MGNARFVVVSPLSVTAMRGRKRVSVSLRAGSEIVQKEDGTFLSDTMKTVSLSPPIVEMRTYNFSLSDTQINSCLEAIIT